MFERTFIDAYWYLYWIIKDLAITVLVLLNLLIRMTYFIFLQ